MAVFKRWKGIRIDSRHPKYAEARWCMYRRINGRTIHKSLPEARTKEQAELAERKEVEKIFNRKYGVTDTETTFGEFCETKYKPYYQQKNVNLVAKKIDVDLLNKYWQTTPLVEITPQDCRNVQHLLSRRPKRGKKEYGTISPSSVNRTMTTASRIFSLAGQEGILDRNPMQFVENLKEPPPRSRLLTAEEKVKLWRELEKDTLLLRLVTLAVNVPLRRGQLLAVSTDAIDLENGLLLATASKGRPERLIPLNSIALNTITAMIKDSQIPFPLKDFRKRWHKALDAAGIEGFNFHDLRKEFASELIRNNVNPNVVQKLFAHSSLSITDIYMHSNIDELKAAVDTLDATILQPSQELDGPPN